MGERRKGLCFLNTLGYEHTALGREKAFLSSQCSIFGVAIQLSFNPRTKAVCSESPDHTEMLNTHEALFPASVCPGASIYKIGGVNLLMCL